MCIIHPHTHGNKECKALVFPWLCSYQSDFDWGHPSQTMASQFQSHCLEVETAGFNFHSPVDPSSHKLWSLYQFWGKLPIYELGLPLSWNFFSSNRSWGFCIFLDICRGLAFRCGSFLLFDSCPRPWYSSPSSTCPPSLPRSPFLEPSIEQSETVFNQTLWKISLRM